MLSKWWSGAGETANPRSFLSPRTESSCTLNGADAPLWGPTGPLSLLVRERLLRNDNFPRAEEKGRPACMYTPTSVCVPHRCQKWLLVDILEFRDCTDGGQPCLSGEVSEYSSAQTVFMSP